MAKKQIAPVNLPEMERRYNAMQNLERAHSQMMYMQTQMMANKFFQGVDPRRKQELADAGMIEEDHRAVANLSPRAIHREFNRHSFYSSPYIDDEVEE